VTTSLSHLWVAAVALYAVFATAWSLSLECRLRRLAKPAAPGWAGDVAGCKGIDTGV
jgi:hypothetical protein